MGFGSKYHFEPNRKIIQNNKRAEFSAWSLKWLLVFSYCFRLSSFLFTISCRVYLKNIVPVIFWDKLKLFYYFPLKLWDWNIEKFDFANGVVISQTIFKESIVSFLVASETTNLDSVEQLSA